VELIDFVIGAGGMDMKHYMAILDGKPGAYGVSFPDAPGCVAMGETAEEALRYAVLALTDWVGEDDPPVARSIETLRLDEDVREQIAEGGVFVVVPLIRESGRLVRANISMDAGLLEAIDAAAERAGVTRSAFLVGAARDKIVESA
jgi:predicted RNase H-like HicB family nuclease